MTKSLSTNQELDIAIAVCEALKIDADNDDNLWAMIECIDMEAIAEQWQEEIFDEEKASE